MMGVWEGMALQQGHKSCGLQSHCQHSLTSVDKAHCSPGEHPPLSIGYKIKFANHSLFKIVPVRINYIADCLSVVQVRG